jgi:type I restriction enzyme M protein
MSGFSDKAAFIWSVADLLRGDFKQSDYGKVILPFTVLRRLDCVLEPTKPAVLAELEKRRKMGVNPEPFLLKAAGQHFCNTSPLDLKALMGDQDHLAENLRAYVQAFSPEVRDILVRFDFDTQIDRLKKANLLYSPGDAFGRAAYLVAWRDDHRAFDVGAWSRGATIIARST